MPSRVEDVVQPELSARQLDRTLSDLEVDALGLKLPSPEYAACTE